MMLSAKTTARSLFDLPFGSFLSLFFALFHYRRCKWEIIREYSDQCNKIDLFAVFHRPRTSPCAIAYGVSIAAFEPLRIVVILAVKYYNITRYWPTVELSVYSIPSPAIYGIYKRIFSGNNEHYTALPQPFYDLTPVIYRYPDLASFLSRESIIW